MNEEEERALINRLTKESDEFWEEQRKRAFPDPPQTAGPPTDEGEGTVKSTKK